MAAVPMLDPTVRWSSDPDDPGTIAEIKTRIVLYLDAPPGPGTAGRIYELYMRRYGGLITQFRSTAYGSIADRWTPRTRDDFERNRLPKLRSSADWGYMFGNDDLQGAPVFLFHGSRPASEPGRASIVRCDFGRDFDPLELRDFVQTLLDEIECVCGTAGYVVAQGEAQGASDVAPAAVYALAMRFWGAEAQDLEASIECAKDGFPCINWTTIVGRRLLNRSPAAVAAARAVAHECKLVNGHLFVCAEPRPRLIDRNRREPLGNYSQVANALLPFQAKAHPSFDGDPWDEDLTHRYLHRFSEPHLL